MHMGAFRFSRETILEQHTPDAMKDMLPGAILILDGTYVHTKIIKF